MNITNALAYHRAIYASLGSVDTGSEQSGTREAVPLPQAENALRLFPEWAAGQESPRHSFPLSVPEESSTLSATADDPLPYKVQRQLIPVDDTIARDPRFMPDPRMTPKPDVRSFRRPPHLIYPDAAVSDPSTPLSFPAPSLEAKAGTADDSGAFLSALEQRLAAEARLRPQLLGDETEALV